MVTWNAGTTSGQCVTPKGMRVMHQLDLKILKKNVGKDINDRTPYGDGLSVVKVCNTSVWNVDFGDVEASTHYSMPVVPPTYYTPGAGRTQWATRQIMLILCRDHSRN